MWRHGVFKGDLSVPALTPRGWLPSPPVSPGFIQLFVYLQDGVAHFFSPSPHPPPLSTLMSQSCFSILYIQFFGMGLLRWFRTADSATRTRAKAPLSLVTPDTWQQHTPKIGYYHLTLILLPVKLWPPSGGIMVFSKLLHDSFDSARLKFMALYFLFWYDFVELRALVTGRQ